MKELLNSAMNYTQAVMNGLESINDSGLSGSEAKQTHKQKQSLVILNYIGMLYITVVSTTIFLTAVFLSIPVYTGKYMYSEDSAFWSQIIACFFYFNFVVNYLMILYGAVQSVYCSPKELPLYNVTTHEDWIRCGKCDRSVPPRTRHCNICDRCILKRDHHCFFTGCCIGFYNQRYFINLNIHSFLGALYTLYFLHDYLSSNYVTFFSLEFYKYLMPYTVIIWLLGYQDLGTVLLVLLFYMSIVGSLVAAYFLAWQFNLIINGQTSYEFVKGQKLYQSNITTHLRSVFGPYWFLNCIIPLPCLKPEDDGIVWKGISTKFL